MPKIILSLIFFLATACSSEIESVDKRTATNAQPDSADATADVAENSTEAAAEESAPSEDLADKTEEEPAEEVEEAPKEPDTKMSFFVTSKSISRSGDLGGIAGADAFCNTLGESKGVAGDWRAYLSTTNADGSALENARDRIGDGPWYNQAEVMLSANLADLHDKVTPPNLFLNEEGALTPRARHDILTGSDAQGNALADQNCENWTSGNNGDAGMVGHVDLAGGGGDQSWNAKHGTSCEEGRMRANGGAGYIYCFRKIK